MRAADVINTVFIISYINAYDYNPFEAADISYAITWKGAVAGLAVSLVAGFTTDYVGFGLIATLIFLVPGICFVCVINYADTLV